MKKMLTLLLVIAVLAVFTACSKPAEQPKQPAPVPPAPVNKPAPAPAAPAPAAPAATAPAATAPATAPAAPAAPTASGDSPLVGTNWVLDDYKVTFKDATTFSLKIGQMPQGIDGTYTLKDGVLEIKAMGMTKKGTFDGTKLTVDGKEATRQQ